MYAMIKKLLCAAACFLLAFSSAGLHISSGGFNADKALAATEYARILNEKTPFYSDPDLRSVKFYLPYSYFVRVVSEGVDSTRVIYMENNDAPAREGYIKTCDLFVCDYTPEAPYPDLKLVLKSDEVLFSDPVGKTARVVLSIGDAACYYGELTVDSETFYYVYTGIYVGYVRKNAFFDHTLSLHPQPIPKTEVPDSASNLQTQPSFSSPDHKIYDVDVITVIVVVSISLVSLSVIYVLFRPEARAAKKAASGDGDDYN